MLRNPKQRINNRSALWHLTKKTNVSLKVSQCETQYSRRPRKTQTHNQPLLRMICVCETQSQGEIRCFRNSEMLRKPDGSKFRYVSAGRLRRETCKMKMEALFRVSAALPLT